MNLGQQMIMIRHFNSLNKFELKSKTFSESFRYCAIKPCLEEVHDGLALIFTPFFVVSEADETPYYYDKKESV